MNTTTRRLAGLGIASAAATVALAAPANAVLPPGPAAPTHPFGSTTSSSDVTVSSGTDWAQIGYGAAGGVALAAAGITSVMVLRRRQRLPYHA